MNYSFSPQLCHIVPQRELKCLALEGSKLLCFSLTAHPLPPSITSLLPCLLYIFMFALFSFLSLCEPKWKYVHHHLLPVYFSSFVKSWLTQTLNQWNALWHWDVTKFPGSKPGLTAALQWWHQELLLLYNKTLTLWQWCYQSADDFHVEKSSGQGQL